MLFFFILFPLFSENFLVFLLSKCGFLLLISYWFLIVVLQSFCKEEDSTKKNLFLIKGQRQKTEDYQMTFEIL